MTNMFTFCILLSHFQKRFIKRNWILFVSLHQFCGTPICLHRLSVHVKALFKITCSLLDTFLSSLRVHLIDRHHAQTDVVHRFIDIFNNKVSWSGFQWHVRNVILVLTKCCTNNTAFCGSFSLSLSNSHTHTHTHTHTHSLSLLQVSVAKNINI